MKKATQNGARLGRCAEVIGLSPRTLKRWQQDLDGPATGDKRPTAKRPPQANQLTPKRKICQAYCKDNLLQAINCNGFRWFGV